MYLSKVTLDLHKSETALALVRPSRMHGAVERSFAGGRQHALWRIDRNDNGAVLLIASEDKPELSELQRQFGLDSVAPAAISYDGFIDSLTSGWCYRFRFTANPTVKINGKRVPMVVCGASRHGNAADWAISRLEKIGLRVEDIRILEHRDVMFTREDGQRIRFLQVTYEGFCTVDDAEAARKALRSGIGHEKAFGCGMLTLRPEW